MPAACSGDGAAGRCRLHVAFHGCKQGASYVKDAFVQQSGYLAAADAGHIVVLFPQVEPQFPAPQSERVLGLVGLHR